MPEKSHFGTQFYIQTNAKSLAKLAFLLILGINSLEKGFLSPLLRARHPKSFEQVNNMGTKHPQNAPFGTQFHAFRQFAYFFRRLFCGLPLLVGIIPFL